MNAQSYANHRRYPLQRYVLPTVLFLIFGGAIFAWKLPETLGDGIRGMLPAMIGFGMLLQWFYTRVMVNRVQDRAIRAEEGFRHYALTGKPLPTGLTLRQIISLRFASDGEFPALALQAAAERLSGEAIKKNIKEWRPDNHRA
ncbi:MAG: hypothetical protein JWP91_747 [Fibrobacteres bacterium]|nr:hypothetical protein [Fibrobacterota bacterium]